MLTSQETWPSLSLWSECYFCQLFRLVGVVLVVVALSSQFPLYCSEPIKFTILRLVAALVFKVEVHVSISLLASGNRTGPSPVNTV